VSENIQCSFLEHTTYRNVSAIGETYPDRVEELCRSVTAWLRSVHERALTAVTSTFRQEITLKRAFYFVDGTEFASRVLPVVSHGAQMRLKASEI
jgi:hypothetical protein